MNYIINELCYNTPLLKNILKYMSLDLNACRKLFLNDNLGNTKNYLILFFIFQGKFYFDCHFLLKSTKNSFVLFFLIFIMRLGY